MALLQTGASDLYQQYAQPALPVGSDSVPDDDHDQTRILDDVEHEEVADLETIAAALERLHVWGLTWIGCLAGKGFHDAAPLPWYRSRSRPSRSAGQLSPAPGLRSHRQG